jgi:hypothetical protein
MRITHDVIITGESMVLLVFVQEVEVAVGEALRVRYADGRACEAVVNSN